jgi:hypothetical protein
MEIKPSISNVSYGSIQTLESRKMPAYKWDATVFMNSVSEVSC